jgi:hypothetical protein
MSAKQESVCSRCECTYNSACTIMKRSSLCPPCVIFWWSSPDMEGEHDSNGGYDARLIHRIVSSEPPQCQDCSTKAKCVTIQLEWPQYFK